MTDAMTDEATLTPIRAAIDAMGGVTAAAAKLEVTRRAVYQWLDNPEKLPAARARDIENATAGQHTRQMLRPDLFG